MNDIFEKALKEATEAGNVAGENWLKDRIGGKYKLVGNRLYDLEGNIANPMLDVCGGAYIEIKDRRTKFAKYLKSISKYGQVHSVDINHKFCGWQDMGLKETTIYAAYEVLTKIYGIKGLQYKSFID